MQKQMESSGIVVGNGQKPLIRRVRDALGLSQEAFAREMGRSYASIRAYDSGKPVPMDVMARAMSRCVRAGLMDLADEVESVAHKRLDKSEATDARSDKLFAVRMHSLLDQVINSEDEFLALSVARLLEMSVYWLSSGRSGAIDNLISNQDALQNAVNSFASRHP